MLPKPKLKLKPGFTYVTRNDAVPGYVYIFRQSGKGLVKIGLSRTPIIRKRYLQQDYGQLQTIAIVWVFNMKFIESQMHKMYAPRRICLEYWKSGFTEWFKTDFTTAFEMRIYLHLLSFCINSAVVLAIGSVIALILFLILR